MPQGPKSREKKRAGSPEDMAVTGRDGNRKGRTVKTPVTRFKGPGGGCRIKEGAKGREELGWKRR